MCALDEARDTAVELLDRALAYSRGTLASVCEDRLGLATPCAAWDLGQLLAHMEDALDAFSEGARGAIAPSDAPSDAPRDAPSDAPGEPVPGDVRIRSVQQKAAALLGAWSVATPAQVRLGEHLIDSSVVALSAALEITVHGWDVARSTGLGTPIPDDLAHQLMPVALALIDDTDRQHRFARSCTRESRLASDLLLAFLGRDPSGPLHQ